MHGRHMVHPIPALSRVHAFQSRHSLPTAESPASLYRQHSDAAWHTDRDTVAAIQTAAHTHTQRLLVVCHVLPMQRCDREEHLVEGNPHHAL